MSSSSQTWDLSSSADAGVALPSLTSSDDAARAIAAADDNEQEVDGAMPAIPDMICWDDDIVNEMMAVLSSAPPDPPELTQDPASSRIPECRPAKL